MRTNANSRWGHYRKTINGDKCVYCGDISTTEDHFPPKSYSHKGVLLPCCKECNSLAGTNYPTDFIKRSEYVKFRIRKRHRSKMNVGEFSVDEIEEFTGNLKRSINLWQTQRRTVRARIAWNAMLYIASIDKNNDFVQTCVDLDGITEKD